jgi:hypothetical protein
MSHQPGHVDGNALAGPLSEVFAVDITTATATCAGCGLRSRVAQLLVYGGGAGSVARCPGCEDVVLRFLRTATDAVLDLRGSLSLVVPLAT